MTGELICRYAVISLVNSYYILTLLVLCLRKSEEIFPHLTMFWLNRDTLVDLNIRFLYSVLL